MTDSPQPLRGLPLWWAWLAWVTAGEISGFAIPALVGSVVVTAPATVQLPGFLIAGVAEGAILGYAQTRVLRRALPRLSPSRWTVATSLGAGIAWAAGVTPGYTWSYLGTAPLPALVAGGVLLGGALLLAIGWAQWLVLRHLVVRAGWWVPATAVAWLAGLAGFAAVSTPLWRPGQPWLLTAVVGVLAGAVMAAMMAAVTGAALVRLLAGQSCEPERAGNRRDIRTAV